MMGRNVAESLPVSEDGAHAGSGLFAEADATERGDNGRVAYLFLRRIQ